MPATPKRKRAGALSVVPYPDNSGALLAELSDLMDRVAAGEVVALATVEILRGGEIQYADTGGDSGYRHLLVAGSLYLQRHLMDEE